MGTLAAMTTSSAPVGSSATVFTARCPEDVLAVVPVVLGFVPVSSVVMLTFGARHCFHARVDLPSSRAEIPEVVASLLDPAQRNAVRRVVLVVYTDDETMGTRVWRALRASFEQAGIEVVEGLRTDGHRWFPFVGRDPRIREIGVPYDVSTHRFAAQAVWEGKVTLDSREALAATLDAEPEAVAEVDAAVAALGARPQGDREVAWVRDLVQFHTHGRSTPTTAEVARLVRDVQDLALRDAAWSMMARETSEAHVTFWTHVVSATPERLVAPTGTLLGFAAWLAGHGALAWCAIERVARVDPDYRLMTYLAQLLTHAVPPATWEGAGHEDAGPPA